MRIPRSLIPPIGITIQDEETDSQDTDEIVLESAQSETDSLEIASVENTSQRLEFEVKLLCDKHTSKQLKELCREKGLLLGGTKIDLASRLAQRCA